MIIIMNEEKSIILTFIKEFTKYLHVENGEIFKSIKKYDYDVMMMMIMK
jgi:hypothetical protein